jgi:hypothetical protein
MGRFVFSIPPDFVAPKSSRAAVGLAKPPAKRRTARQAKAKLQWETADGRATGKPIELRLPDTVVLEYPHSDGRIAWADQPVSPAFSDEPPDEAAALKLSVPGRAAVRIPRAALTAQLAALPTPQTETFGPSDAMLLVPVFSERFVDKNAFMAKVRELREWIIAQPPFDREPTRSRIALVAHFWPSDANEGLFHTTDDRSQGGQLFYGDREAARTLLQRWAGNARVSLILINSSKRGGAGGQKGYSAWTSIAPAPGERWENVCLHEIGHGLGLADEYLQDPPPNQPPATLEPNVSRSAVPSQTPWGDFDNLLPDVPAPSFTMAGENSAPADAIGTFEGARYRRDFYRASRTCLMRDTRQSFCIVCQKHIETVLSTPFIV